MRDGLKKLDTAAMNTISDGPCSADREISMQDPNAVRRFDTSKLLEGKQEVVIVHKGVDYRLRVTSNGKLILTK